MSSQTDKITENIVKAKIDKYRLEQGISEQQYIDMNAKEKQEVYIQSIRDFGVDDFGKTLISLLDSSLRRSLPQDIINDSYVYNDLMTSSLNHLLTLSNESNIVLDFTNYDNISGIMNMSIGTAIRSSTITQNKFKEFENSEKNNTIAGLTSIAAILNSWDKATDEQKETVWASIEKSFYGLIDNCTNSEQKKRLQDEKDKFRQFRSKTDYIENTYRNVEQEGVKLSFEPWIEKIKKSSPEITSLFVSTCAKLGIDMNNIPEERQTELRALLNKRIQALYMERKRIVTKFEKRAQLENGGEILSEDLDKYNQIKSEIERIQDFIDCDNQFLDNDILNEINEGNVGINFQRKQIKYAFHDYKSNRKLILDIYDTILEKADRHIDSDDDRKILHDSTKEFKKIDTIRSSISKFKGPQDKIAGFIYELTTSTAYIEYAKKLPTHDGGTKQKDLTGFFENLQRQIALATIDFAQFGEREYSLEQKKQGTKALEESAKTGKVIFEIVDKYMPIFQKNENNYMENQAKDLSYTINDTETPEVKTIEEMLHETMSALLDSKDIDESGQVIFKNDDIRETLDFLKELMEDETFIEDLKGKTDIAGIILNELSESDGSIPEENLNNYRILQSILSGIDVTYFVDDSKRQELIDAIDKQVKELESEEKPISNFETEDFLAGNFVEMNIDAITTDRSQDMPTQENEEKIDEDKVDTATPTEEQYKVEEIIVGAESKAEEIAREESDFDILADDDAVLASTSTSNPESNALVTTNERTGFLGAITTFINNIRTALYQTNNEKDEQGEKKSFFRRFVDKYNEIKESQNNKSNALKTVPETDVTKETEKSEELSQTGSVYDAKKPIDQYIVNTPIAPLKESTPKTVKDEEPVISDDEIR